MFILIFQNAYKIHALFDKSTKKYILWYYFRYLEATKLKKSLEGIQNSKKDDALIIASLLVGSFDKSIPDIMRQNYIQPPNKNIYKNTG